MKFSNYLGNIFFSFFYSFILEQKITDTLCGTKILFKKDWQKIKEFCGKWGVKDKWGDFDILSGAKINMMKIAEVPVHYKERIEGETKMTNTIFNGIRMLIICIISFLDLGLLNKNGYIFVIVLFLDNITQKKNFSFIKKNVSPNFDNFLI